MLRVLILILAASVTPALAAAPAGAPRCGNGTVEAGETCDDGNTSDNDECPADCTVDTCTPDPEQTVEAIVSFEAPYSVLVAGMSLLVDYPEGKVTLSGTGRVPAEQFRPTPREGRFLIAAFDLDHATRVVAASDKEIEHGELARLTFTRCKGAEAPSAGDFACSVIEASDPHQNARDGVRCSVELR